MQNLTVSQLTLDDINAAIRDAVQSSLAAFFTSNQFPVNNDDDEIGDIQAASRWSGYAVPTIYSRINDFPHFKKNGKLFFSKKDVISWIRDGRRKTASEIQAEAETFQPKNKRAAKATL